MPSKTIMLLSHNGKMALHLHCHPEYLQKEHADFSSTNQKKWRYTFPAARNSSRFKITIIAIISSGL